MKRPTQIICIILGLIAFNYATARENSYPQNQLAHGLIIKVGTQFKKFDQKNLLIFAENDLKEKKYYQNLHIYSFKLSTPIKDKKKLLKICKSIVQQRHVENCELNLELMPDMSKEKIGSPKKYTEPDSRFFSPPHPEDSELSTFWAQEYTGADLLREKLEKLNPPLDITGIVSIWDSRDNLHAHNVSHLIQSNHFSGLIPAPSITYSEMRFTEKYLDYADNYCNEEYRVTQGQSSPRFINNSMRWFHSQEIAQAIEKMILQKDIIFVTSAGNMGQQIEYVDAGKESLAKKKLLITVGSIHPSGEASTFTNFSPHLSISAPSDRFLTSFDGEKLRYNFGGTSGAAPQVTAALAIFELISGLRLTPKDALRLLEKTAIPLPGILSMRPNNLGPGMLNTYFIGELAFKLKKSCQNEIETSKCLKQNFNQDGFFYTLSDSTDLLNQTDDFFPNCSNPSLIFKKNKPVIERKNYLTKIRQKAYLEINNHKLWKIIYCASKEERLQRNAQFYEKLATPLSPKEIEKLGSENSMDFIKYILSHPYWVERIHSKSHHSQ